MPRSKAFEDHIFSKTFTALRRSQGKIIADRSLSQHMLNQLADEAMSSFGYSSLSAAKSDIYQIFAEICRGDSSMPPAKTLDLRNLAPGSLVSIEYEGGWTLHTIYASAGELIVADDMERSLLPGDRLRPLSLILESGQPATFQVIRNDARYPSDSLYFHLPGILAIYVNSNGGAVNMEAKPNDEAISGLCDVYARAGDRDGAWFNPADLSGSPERALFRISFHPDGSVSYSFNPDHAIDLSSLPQSLVAEQYDLLLEQLRAMCDFSECDQHPILSKITTVDPGILVPCTLPNGHECLKVAKRAILSHSTKDC